MSKARFEEFEPADESSNAPKGSRSYDIIAGYCGTSASTLESYARIRRLMPNCRMYQHITDYVTKSSGTTKVTINRIYKINRKNERRNFTDKHRMILWHGTKPNCVPGIIQTGFRPGSGGLFGGGIYFADRIGKSLGYTGKASGNVGFLFLAEVNLGRVYKAHHTHSDYKSAPQGFHTVKGNGSQIPTWRQNVDYYGAILPCGDTQQNPRFPQYDLTYSEYIAYDPDRIILRFLVECTW